MTKKQEEAEAVEVEETPAPEDNTTNTELAEFVRDLVYASVKHEMAELEQRLADLELLTAQPEGAVRFEHTHTEHTPSQQVPDYVQAHQDDEGVPWYRA